MTKAEAIKVAVATAREGVTYSLKDGAVCPLCGARCPVVSSPRGEGALKVRYHRCNNAECVMGALGVSVKSVQREG
ncbi:transcriptional regulator [Pseudodesulfovibrio pelocollis]|uniref:transcriptional regulator n=1 Tax=Pseudodesulfovibrio pelocollis TaxID=3051432 RepID=UPI00255AAAC9|nr:transcriptional regulator [Pseudodesulfovibrio sp. SB368]